MSDIGPTSQPSYPVEKPGFRRAREALFCFSHFSLHQFAGILRLIVATWQLARLAKRFDRFSNYRLKDIGFERDWNGAISRQNPEPEVTIADKTPK